MSRAIWLPITARKDLTVWAQLAKLKVSIQHRQLRVFKGQPSLETLPASAGERGVCSLSAAGARHLLHSSDYGEIRCLECEAQAEVLILRGQVSTRIDWGQPRAALTRSRAATTSSSVGRVSLIANKK